MLDIRELSKIYPLPPLWLRPLMRVAADEPVHALRDVTIQVAAGEIVGILGPNGAGKTTLIKLICGLLEPTAGWVRIDGVEVTADPGGARSRLGLVLAEDRGLYWRLTGRQNLEFFGVLSGLGRRESRRRADDLLEFMELAGRDRLVFGYSSGMRTRLAIARALLTEPPLLVLDEPTRSLDPLASVVLNQRLRRLADDGHAILLASHRLDEVSAICDRAVVLVDGRVRQQSPVRELELASSDLAALLTSVHEELEGDE